MPLENDNKDEEIFIGTKDYPLKIQFKTYKGKKYIDIRKWFLERKTNEVLPTKKGISLSEHQFESMNYYFSFQIFFKLNQIKFILICFFQRLENLGI